MKVIKINKIYQNGSISHFKVLNGDITNDNINSIVEEWCENELTGKIYGYSYNWELVEDKTQIKQIIKNKIEITNNKITKLINEKNNLQNYLSKL